MFWSSREGSSDGVPRAHHNLGGSGDMFPTYFFLLFCVILNIIRSLLVHCTFSDQELSTSYQSKGEGERSFSKGNPPLPPKCCPIRVVFLPSQSPDTFQRLLEGKGSRPSNTAFLSCPR